MIENIKKRIIHFYTHGNIIEDFVEARRKKSVKLRRVIHACFYIQCAAAAGCIISALALGTGAAAAAIAAGSIASCVVAFISLGGGTAEKTILYILNLVYAVICFAVGGLGGSPAFAVCGVIMLFAALAALAGFFAAWCRQYLLDFSPAKITRSDYTRLSLSFEQSAAAPGPEPMFSAPTLPLPPPPPPRTEMESLADRLSEILGGVPDPTLPKPPAPPAVIPEVPAAVAEKHLESVNKAAAENNAPSSEPVAEAVTEAPAVIPETQAEVIEKSSEQSESANIKAADDNKQPPPIAQAATAENAVIPETQTTAVEKPAEQPEDESVKAADDSKQPPTEQAAHIPEAQTAIAEKPADTPEVQTATTAENPAEPSESGSADSVNTASSGEEEARHALPAVSIMEILPADLTIDG